VSAKVVTYKACPQCGENRFRPLEIMGEGILWKCKSCIYTEKESLPEITKKIIYMDQVAVSCMARSRRGKKEPRWNHLFDRLKQLIEDQLIVCPESLYHEYESELGGDLADVLEETYEVLSAGVDFKHPHEIEQKQIYDSWMKFIGEDTKEGYHFDWNDALRGSPHQWHGRFVIKVNRYRDPQAIEERRQSKEIVRQKMQELYVEDYSYTERPFEQELREEQFAHAKAIWDDHWKGLKGHAEALIGLQVPSVEGLLGLVHSHSMMIIQFIDRLDPPPPETPPYGIMGQFLFSEHFYNTPYVYIESLIFAALARKVRASGRKASLGDFYDVPICSRFLPYCDAMFLDNEYRGMLQEGGVVLHEQYDTKLFSSRTMDEFLAYLDEIEQSCDHIDFIRPVSKKTETIKFFALFLLIFDAPGSR